MSGSNSLSSSPMGSPTHHPQQPSTSPTPTVLSQQPPSTATKRKVLSFFTSLTSEIDNRLKHSNAALTSLAPTASPTPVPVNHSASTSAATLTLQLAKSALVPTIHIPIKAIIEPPSTSFAYRWTRVTTNGTSTVVSTNTGSDYVPTIDDVDCHIQCDATTTATATITATIGPVTLSSHFLRTALLPFANNTVQYNVSDRDDGADLTVTVRRTSVRVTQSSSGQTRHSFRLSSQSSVNSLTIVTDTDGDSDTGLTLTDSITDRMFRAKCHDPVQRDSLVLLVRLLLQQPDFTVNDEIDKAEKLEQARRKEAEEARARKEAERARVLQQQQEAEAKRLADDELQRQQQQQLPQPATAQPVADSDIEVSAESQTQLNFAETAQPNIPIAMPSPTHASASSIHVTANTTTTTTTTVAPVMSTVTMGSIDNEGTVPAPTPFETLILPVGAYASLLASSSSLPATQREVQSLNERIAALTQQTVDDSVKYSTKLESLIQERLALQQSNAALQQDREKLSKQSCAEIQKLTTEIADLQHDVETLKKNHSLTVEELIRQHNATIVAVNEDNKKSVDRLTQKAANTETQLRKELELYKKELNRLKEKEARVDVLEMENHRVSREYSILSEELARAKHESSNKASHEVNQQAEIEKLKSHYEAIFTVLTSERDQYKDEIDDINSHGIKLGEQMIALETSYSQATTKIEELTQSLSETEFILSEQSASFAKLQTELAQYRAKSEEFESVNNYNKNHQQTLKAQIEKLIKSQAALKQELKEASLIHSELKEEIRSLRLENASLTKRVHEMERQALEARSGDSGAVSDNTDYNSVSSSQSLQIDALKSLCNKLTEQINDQDTALTHLKKTNQILGLRVKTLEDKFRRELEAEEQANGHGRAMPARR